MQGHRVYLVSVLVALLAITANRVYAQDYAMEQMFHLWHRRNARE